MSHFTVFEEWWDELKRLAKERDFPLAEDDMKVSAIIMGPEIHRLRL